MVDPEKLQFLKRLDIVIGGDHGGAKFRMTMKVNFRLSEKESVPYLTQLARISFSKDDTEILNDTVFQHIGEGLRLIAEGGCFIVTAGLEVSFLSQDMTSDLTVNCSANLFLAGDLIFFPHMSG
jgi:hypothetical protein